MEIFIQIGIAILLAGILGFIAKIAKQPLILAFILTGIILGPSVFGVIAEEKEIYYFSTLGITFLLFLVGLDLNLKKLKGLSFYATVIGLSQVIFTFVFGFLIAFSFGFSVITSIYIALALTFSSTAIVIKLYSEKKELNSLHGKLVIGILIIQDVVALLALILLQGLGDSASISIQSLAPVLGLTLLKGFILLVFTYISSRYLLPFIFKFISRSAELLFLVSLSWCLGVTLLAYYMGLSIEIGAFLAGISLATTPYSLEITGRIKPLRDFFITIFFIALGIQLTWENLSQNIPLMIIFSLFVLIGNPLILMIVMGLLGFRKRTSFLTAISCAQISEFSLILILLGYTLGHFDSSVVSLITGVAIITITVSSYLITYDNKIYSKIRNILKIFERKNKVFKKLHVVPENLENHVIVFGCDRMGSIIIKSLQKASMNFIVVDFNPEIIQKLKKQNINAVFGDAEDPEIMEKVNIPKSKMIISTIPDFETNMTLLAKIKGINDHIITYITAEDAHEALILYKENADYVILPQALSGKYISFLLEKFGDKKENFALNKKAHIQELQAQNIN